VLSPELVLPPGTGIIWSWSGSRVRTNGTPWLESILEKILRDNIGQFKADKPTFLVWVTSDLSLAGLKTHVSRVLEQYGHIDFINVAGVIICDSFLWWDLTENPATRYREMKDSGLFDAIRGIKPHRQAG
jgi:preprotein translocase subunit SecY